MNSEQAKQRAKAKRLQDNYRITTEIRTQIADVQERKCGICGRPESDFTVPLQVDHKHFKVHTHLNPPSPTSYKWTAWTEIEGIIYEALANTKERAIADLKDIALPKSVRGLLCPGRYFGCNRLLGRIDKIEWLEKVLTYLRNPPAHKVIPRIPRKGYGLTT